MTSSPDNPAGDGFGPITFQIDLDGVNAALERIGKPFRVTEDDVRAAGMVPMEPAEAPHPADLELQAALPHHTGWRGTQLAAAERAEYDEFGFTVGPWAGVSWAPGGGWFAFTRSPQDVAAVGTYPTAAEAIADRPTYTPGQPVEFTMGPLATQSGPASTRVRPETVGEGDRGEYHGPHLDGELADKGWHLVRATVGGARLWVAVHEDMFRPVEG